ncbi:hypothetical protein [Microbacterium sp. Root61]|uniref:hypothetical protein n=1 Tax=Microbacterium sp. Root61 TaxID=1736570 RepID=UPI0012E33FB1|nr:hypothetical protein [Microbacterium sp. Root61]
MIALLVIVAIMYLVTSRRRAAQAQVDRERAADLRSEAEARGLDALDREAEAARADADAQQARATAERLSRESEIRHTDADTLRSEAEQTYKRADTIDPDVDGSAGDTGQPSAPKAPQ